MKLIKYHYHSMHTLDTISQIQAVIIR